MDEESLFAAALEMSDPAERQAFLDEACGGDAALRQRVERLLAADEHTTGILEHGPAGAALNAPPWEPPLAADRVFADRFKLRQKLGEGGMGEVWVADQVEPVQRRVALKVVRPGLDSARLLARFEQERQALARMDHPNIAKVLDAGTTAGGRPYFVMELIQGVPITEYCDTAKLSPRERMELFVPVCQAVQHAHQKGIIHRDLKPGNVLIALYDSKPVPKVIDFGVAKTTGERLSANSVSTEVGALVGTLEYMSPEQAELNNLDIDTRSDVYALGVLLYELLTGGVPHAREELRSVPFAEMLWIIKEVEPPRPSMRLTCDAETLPAVAAARQTEPKKLAALVRGELDWIVMKCLEKDRNRRYETANGLATDLHRYLADEPVLAGPPSAGYRFKKLVRRNKGPAWAAAIVLLTLLAGIGGTAYGLVRANQRAEGERLAKERAEQGFAKAKEAVKQYLEAVTEDSDLKHKHDLHALRKKLLVAAVPFYQWFTEQKPGEAALEAERGWAYERLASVRSELGEKEAALEDYERMRNCFTQLAADFPTAPEYRRQLARSHCCLGIRLKDLGQWRAAEEACRRALDLQEQLAADFPGVPQYRQDLAMYYNTLGVLLMELGRWSEAEQAHRRALALHEQLAADFPTVPEHRQEVARSLCNLGVLLNELGRRPAAEQAYRRAVDLQEKLAAAFPTVPGYRHGLGMTHNNLGLLLAEMGQQSAAEQAYHRALFLHEQLAAAFPTVPEYRRQVAGTSVNFGNLLRDQGQAEASLPWFAKAIALLEPLVQREPLLATARRFLRNAHWGRARALDRLDRPTEAVKDWDRALALNDAPATKLLFRRKRALSLARAGDHVRAVAEANAVAESKGVTGGTLYDLACVCALAAAAAKDDAKHEDQYAARAVELLRQAVAAGFTDVTHMKKDKDLDSLREREEVKKLLAEWEARQGESRTKKHQAEKKQ
jgi:tetratricopeptide (TPR) repeat protein/tRNA A-37 threonylcarbamoyl transferase component Bud32